MGEINFLSSKDPKDKEKDSDVSSKDDKAKVDVDNDEPEKFIPANQETAGQDKERIEKSREEVLEMIDKNKKTDLKEKKDEKKPAKKSFFGGIFGNKENKQDKKIEKNEKNEKTEKNKKDIEKKAPAPSPTPAAGQKLSPTQSSDSAAVKKPIKDDGPLIFSGNTWTNSGVLETNLIDKNEYSFFDFERKLKYLLISFLGIVLLVGSAYLGLFYYEYKEIYRLEEMTYVNQDMINDLMKKEASIKKAKEFQGKLDTAKILLDKHMYWTEFFKFLEDVTIKDVSYINGFSGDQEGIYTLDARTDTYESLKEQLLVYTNDKRVLDVKTTSVAKYEKVIQNETLETETEDIENPEENTELEPETEEGIEFSVEISIDKNVFYKSDEKNEETIKK